MADDLDDLVRRVDPDRWLASRFIGDAAERADVVALYAFDHELARAIQVASNPLVAELRLAWWREALDEMFDARPLRAHPGVEGLARCADRRSLTRPALEAMIDGRYRELDPAPMTAAELAEWADATAGAAAALAAGLLDPQAPPQAARAAGSAWTLARRWRAAPEGDRTAAQAAFATAADQARRLSARAFPAAAFATLARSYLAGRALTDLGKQWRLLWAMTRGRL